MITENYALKSFLTALLLTLILASCNLYEDFPPPQQKPPQTQILQIEILPNDTLAPGDTATFRCIISDSLNSSFQYTWGIDEKEGTKLIKTETNSIEWIAPESSLSYVHNVSVNNGSNDSTSVFKEFTIVVID